MKRREMVFRGRIFRVYAEPLALASGRQVRREIVRHPGSVAILVLDERARVLLLRQFRQAVGRRIWEIPAGTLEPGEQVLRSARRELREETGYRARRWRKLTTILASPGILDERLHLYAAWDLVAGSSRPEADEDIACHWVTLARALAMVRHGSLADAKSICALLYFSQFGGPGQVAGAGRQSQERRGQPGRPEPPAGLSGSRRRGRV
jgi:ADP-ribose pyrophosphatase